MKHVIGVMIAVLLVPVSALAQDFGDLTGSVDVSHVDAKINGRSDETWRQIYTLSWYRRATEYIDLRAGLRYYDFDLDSAEQAFGTFQNEIQPSGELSWDHPWFRFTATGSRRVSRSRSISGELINDSVLLNWESSWTDTPSFGLRYELNDIEETGGGVFSNLQNQSLAATADYRREHEEFNYRIVRRWNENVTRGLSTNELDQRFQYLGAHLLGARRQFQLSSQYRYNRVDRLSEVASGERFLERVEPAQGLGGVDATPDRDPLPIVPGLIDGNTLAPVAPPIGIGSGDLDRNIGVDLGVRRERMAAIYIYTDRLSAATVRWAIWTSDDNLNWDDSAIQFVRSGFNPTVSRYEIEFNEVPARFIKVVNSGVNAIAGVLVTEIEVFEALSVTDEVEQDTSAHLADAGLVWNVNPKTQISTDGLVRLQPPSGSVGQRLEYNYTMRARYQPSYRSAHVLRWSQSWQDFEEDERDLRGDALGYSFLFDPLPTLGASLSANFRQADEGGELSLRSIGALAEANASPWRTIRASAEFGVSRIDQPIANVTNDSWNTRVTLDTDITRQLTALVTWFHQESISDRDNQLRVLQRFTINGELQLTSAIFARAAVSFFDDDNFSRSQDYLLSWRLFTRLLLSGQVSSDYSGIGAKSERYSVNGTLDLFDRFFGFRNVTIFARFSDVDQSEAGGSRILSWQQGLRATF